MVKPPMPCRISAGLLASGTLSRANFQRILNNAPDAFVFFNGTTDDEGVCFLCHQWPPFSNPLFPPNYFGQSQICIRYYHAVNTKSVSDEFAKKAVCQKVDKNDHQCVTKRNKRYKRYK